MSLSRKDEIEKIVKHMSPKLLRAGYNKNLTKKQIIEIKKILDPNCKRYITINKSTGTQYCFHCDMARLFGGYISEDDE